MIGASQTRIPLLTIVLCTGLAACDSGPPVACGELPPQTLHIDGGVVVTPCFEDPEMGPLTIAAKSSKLTTSLTFDVVVASRPPVLLMDFADRLSSVGDALTLNVAPHFEDPDRQTLVFTATSSDSTVVSVSVSGDILTANAGREGTASVMITARDPGGLTATGSLDFTVFAADTVYRNGFESSESLDGWEVEDHDEIVGLYFAIQHPGGTEQALARVFMIGDEPGYYGSGVRITLFDGGQQVFQEDYSPTLAEATRHRLNGDGGVILDGPPPTPDAAGTGPTLVVSGWVHMGRLILDPRLSKMVRWRFPKRMGRTRVEGVDVTGKVRFSLSFSPTPMEFGGGSLVHPPNAQA